MNGNNVVHLEEPTEAIIWNGKRYVLSTSRLIAEHGAGYPETDARYMRERLFLSSKGTWYIVGDGGAETRYGRQHGSQMIGSRDNIRELNRKEAFRHCQEFATQAIVEEHFGDMILEA